MKAQYFAVVSGTSGSPAGLRLGGLGQAMLVAAFDYMNTYLTDGWIDRDALPALHAQLGAHGRGYSVDEFVTACCETGLAESHGERLYFPSFLSVNRPAAERRSLTEKRQAAAHARHSASKSTASAVHSYGVGVGTDPTSSEEISLSQAAKFASSNTTNTCNANAEQVHRARELLEAVGVNLDYVFGFGADRVIEAMVHFAKNVDLDDSVKSVAKLFAATLKARPAVVALPSPEEIDSVFSDWWEGLGDWVNAGRNEVPA